LVSPTVRSLFTEIWHNPMAVRQDTLWERFTPVIRLLIDEEGLRRYHESIDRESDRFRRADVTIPSYYSSQNFPGIGADISTPARRSPTIPLPARPAPNGALIRQV